MNAGSKEVIVYIFWQLVDEILHALDWINFIGNAKWRYNFCKWSHRHD